MKKIFTLICIINMCVSVLHGQDTIEVPHLVRLGLYTDFPKVAKTQWSLENRNVYRAEFSVYRSKLKHIAKYDLSGNWIEKKVGMEFGQLPMSVKEELVARFKIFKSISIVRTEMRNQNPVFHAVIEKWQEGDKPKETYLVDISAEGIILKTSDAQPTTANAE